MMGQIWTGHQPCLFQHSAGTPDRSRVFRSLYELLSSSRFDPTQRLARYSLVFGLECHLHPNQWKPSVSTFSPLLWTAPGAWSKARRLGCFHCPHPPPRFSFLGLSCLSWTVTDKVNPFNTIQTICFFLRGVSSRVRPNCIGSSLASLLGFVLMYRRSRHRPEDSPPRSIFRGSMRRSSRVASSINPSRWEAVRRKPFRPWLNPPWTWIPHIAQKNSTDFSLLMPESVSTTPLSPADPKPAGQMVNYKTHHRHLGGKQKWLHGKHQGAVHQERSVPILRTSNPV